MTIQFSFEEMAQCLRAIGYEIREEKEIMTFRTYHDNTEEEEVEITNCYYSGVKMATWAGPGTKRLEYTFQQELKNRMLKLFNQ